MLDEHQCSSTPLSAHRDALHETESDQQERCKPADLLKCRKYADQNRCGAHHQQRDHERLAPADLVTHSAEEHAAQWPRQESHRESREGGEGPRQRAV